MIDLWASPVLVDKKSDNDVAEMNAALRDYILERESRDEPLTIGTQNASKIGQDFLRMDDDLSRTFQQIILGAATELTQQMVGDAAEIIAQDFVAEAWGVVYRHGGNHRIHAHPGAVWSGVYYVSCAPGEVGGRIEFLDPRPAALASRGDTAGTVSIQPIEGMLVGFPSWLQHSVTPLVKSDERICIAYNIGLDRGGVE